MFDVQFTYSQGALCYQDTNSLWKLDLTKKGNNQAEMTRLILVDKVVTSNNVNVTSAHARGFTNEVATNWMFFFHLHLLFCCFLGWLYHTEYSLYHCQVTTTFCLLSAWRQVQRGWFSGWFSVWYSPWKRNSFPGQATSESQQRDMKQSRARDALPRYPLPFHSHILRFHRESIFPLPHVR